MSDPTSSGIDWAAAKERIVQLDAALNRAEQLTAAEIETILARRAERLAQSIDDEAESFAGLEVMTLMLADERYAIETSIIREVIQPGTFTLLPGSAEHIAGVMNLRGRPLLVIDVRALLGLRRRERTDSARVIVIGTSQVEYGLIADAVEEVTTIAPAAVRETLSSLSPATQAFVRGVTPDGTALLDSTALLNDRRLWVDESDEGNE